MAILRENIPGWGVDLDSANRPAVPKEKHPFGGTGAHWRVIENQMSDVKVFRSVERANMTSVFGTSTPPHGLSGLIRQFAYRFGEDRKYRWMTLLLADRVDVVEGLISDLRSGQIPNIFSEMGWRAEYRYNRKGFYRKIAFTAAVVAGGAMLLGLRRSRHTSIGDVSDL